MKRFYSIHTRVSEREYVAMGQIAKREGLNVSETLRLIIHTEFTRQGFLLGLIETGEKMSVPERVGNA